MSTVIENYWRRRTFALALFGCLALVVGTVLIGNSVSAQKPGKNGTTLAAVKTVDICDNEDGTWHYSGVIAVWNEGVVDTEGLTIQDCIQNKPGAGQFVDVYCGTLAGGQVVQLNGVPGVIPAGTTLATATLFSYSFDAAPLTGDIRNIARIKITNHSGQLGKAFGPEPKATFEGDVEPCGGGDGCTLTQGFWKTHPEAWPGPLQPSDPFFLSGQTYQEVLDTPVNVSQGYYQLAHQYIAAVLNQANGASTPSGVQDTLDLAEAWLSVNGPSACTAGGSCGVQKDWAGILDLYNNGLYPGGPLHCP